MDHMPRKDAELPPRMPEAAIIAELRAENARLRADAQAAAARVVEQAAAFLDGHAAVCRGQVNPMSEHSDPPLTKETAAIVAGKNAKLRHDANRFEVIAAAIRALAPADGLAAVEALRSERDALFRRATLAEEWRDHDKARAEKAEAELAAAQQREAGLTDAVERLVVVLDRNDKKGPIPDVEMMFCWLAAQDIRAAFRAALSHNGRGE